MSGSLQTALVRDSSVIDVVEFALPGQRIVHACCDEHLAVLVRKAKLEWVDEQWWFGLLCQASRDSSLSRASLRQISRRVRLSTEQLDAALRWNAGRADPVAHLPGGQSC
ncbi:hypothetical protein F9C11_24175 [Amycolatopsis sp. VS8301801F10]|uniref:hypothetical protein n=1 Tax=Amycolatopsis sp. VS8301801F10 TaxID=2652442 RepID=UPI0038FCE9EA